MEGLSDKESKVFDALVDVRYHREVFCGQPLYPPQIEAVELVEHHIAEQSGKTITIRSSRQTMKNECSATIHARALALYSKEGGIIVRTAPTHKPQIVNSKLRLEKMVKIDPIIRGKVKKREGYIYECGEAQIQFLSAQDRTNVEGATASLLLDIDEAHKVDKGKFEEAFGPMAAWKAVPTVMWGVAADKQDLLYEYRRYNEEYDPALNLQYPWHVWAELRPEYAKHCEERKGKLGENHPVWLTQYCLIDIEAIAGLLKPWHIKTILTSEHARQTEAVSEKRYVAVIDLAGEEEEGEVTIGRREAPRDATICWIVEVDYTDIVYDMPKFRVVQGYYWVGKQFAAGPDGDKGQQEILLDILNYWRPRKTVIDARGIGAQTAAYVAKRFANVEQYAATADSVSDDCYGFLALAENGRISMWQDDESETYRECVRQLKETKYQIFQHDKIRLIKPQSGAHIDMVKALTYLARCTKKPFERQAW